MRPMPPRGASAGLHVIASEPGHSKDITGAASRMDTTVDWRDLRVNGSHLAIGRSHTLAREIARRSGNTAGAFPLLLPDHHVHCLESLAYRDSLAGSMARQIARVAMALFALALSCVNSHFQLPVMRPARRVGGRAHSDHDSPKPRNRHSGLTFVVRPVRASPLVACDASYIRTMCAGEKKPARLAGGAIDRLARHFISPIGQQLNTYSATG